MRLGILPQDMEFHNPIWVHAVSVGEVMAVKNLIKQLKEAYPQRQILITTVTPTGNRIARNLVQGNDKVGYLPLDFSFIVRRFIDKIDPYFFIAAETEIWPNLVTLLNKKNIPVVIVNGRISDSSFRGYSRVRLFLSPILRKVSFFCIQTARDAERLMSLGVDPKKIKVTGNMKFDLDDCALNKKDYGDLRLKLGLKPEDKLLVCGSTHPGEEKMILGVYKELCRSHPDLRILIAPRHPERSQEVVSLSESLGFKSARVSQLTSQPGVSGMRPPYPQAGDTVFILDTVGELVDFYAIAEVVFIGGSLVKKGGHNILEPAALKKPVLFGPHMNNFRDIASLFCDNQAVIAVRSIEELKIRIDELLKNPVARAVLGEKSRELILKNQGATRRNTECIKTYGN